MPSNNEPTLTKTAYSSTRYTREQLQQLKSCTDPDTGALYFMSNFMWIQHPIKGRMMFDPYPFQKDLIGNYNSTRMSINMCGRQMGKTTVAAGYLLWFAMFIPDSTILIAAHKYTGAQEIMQRIRFAYEQVPDFIRAGVTSYNKGSLEFDNGSRIMSATTTETTARGMSLSLIYLDEFAFVQPRVASEFWTSLSPTLATGGKCIITSTPNNDDDQFATIWREANNNVDNFGNVQEIGKNGFKHYLATWDKHPERDEEWAKTEQSRIGEERFRREHLCEFIIYDETLIDPLVLVGMEGKEPAFKMGQVRWYKKPVKGMTYCLGLDPSLGTGGDYAAIEVLELPTMIQVAEWQHNKTPIPKQIQIVKDILSYIADEINWQEISTGGTDIFWTVENNTVGEAALVQIDNVGEENFRGTMLSEPRRSGHVRRFRKGFNTTHKSKVASCAMFKNMIEQNKLVLNSKPIIRELKSYIARGQTFEAKSGENDDLISAMLLNFRQIQYISTFDEKIGKSFKDSDPGSYEDDVGPFGLI